jgi:hypothetical protein
VDWLNSIDALRARANPHAAPAGKAIWHPGVSHQTFRNNFGAATKAIDPGLCLGRVGVDGEESSSDGSSAFQRPGLRHPAGWGTKEKSACTLSSEARDTGTGSETIRNRIRAFPHRFHTSPRVSEGFNANAKETSTEPIIMSHHDRAPSAAPPILPPVPAPGISRGAGIWQAHGSGGGASALPLCAGGLGALALS